MGVSRTAATVGALLLAPHQTWADDEDAATEFIVERYEGLFPDSVPSAAGCPDGWLAVLVQDFEHRPAGHAYTPEDIDRDFLYVSYPSGAEPSVWSIYPTVRDVPDGNRAMAQHFPRGCADETTCGYQFHVNVPAVDNAWLAYSVYVDEDFKLETGGVLPGLCGGSCPLGPAPSNGSDGFSALAMWESDEGYLNQRLGHSATEVGATEVGATEVGDTEVGATEVSAMDEDDVEYSDTEDGGTEGGGAVVHYASSRGSRMRFSAGNWHHLRHRVRMNDVGVANGELEVWYDGVLAHNATNIVWRTSADVHVDTFKMIGMFGRPGQPASSPQDQSILFDNVVVCRPAEAPVFQEPAKSQHALVVLCPTGTRLVDDACVDLNECAVDNGRCAHVCTNTDGSFGCACREGYTLHANNRSCTIRSSVTDIDSRAASQLDVSAAIRSSPGGLTCGFYQGLVFALLMVALFLV